MSDFLVLAFLFYIGSMCGWILELFFRHFYSKENKKRKWINPGFCVGPYLPIYGFGLCFLYLLAQLECILPFSDQIIKRMILFLIMAICMTVLEYITGILLLKLMNLRLWDYRDEWKNIQGIICPKFSVAWAILGAIYYFFIHSHILQALEWLANNLAFSFVIGMFFGIFIIDVIYSSKIIIRLKKFADENQVIVQIENIKNHIFDMHKHQKRKYHFFKPFETENTLSESLEELKDEFERIKKLYDKQKGGH